jgi:hypothetical protein
MMHKIIYLIILLYTVSVYPQFPDQIELGPSLNSIYSHDLALIRLNGHMHIPGDRIDIEADLTSLAFFPDKQRMERFGISWVALLCLPPTLLKEKVGILKPPAIALLAINALANADISWGNSWVRGFVGWKNDLFLFQKALWIFQPRVGCKLALPESRSINSSVRCGLTFPALVSNDTSIKTGIRNFSPRLFAEFDLYIFYADIFLSAK